MLSALIHKVFGAASAQSAAEQQAVDRVVAATDARLSLLPGFRKALLPGIRISRDYAASLVRDLPDPLELSLLAFTLDRRLGLFFSSPASLLAMLMRCETLQDFFHTPSQGDEALALLLMQRTDTQRYGLANRDGEIRSDVAQIVVSFDHHRMMMPCPSIDALRQRATDRGLDVITRVIARRLELLAKERSDLESELTRIRLRLTALVRPDAVLIDAMPADDSLPQDREGLLRRQSSAQERLGEVRSVTELSGLLELVAHMLSHPQDYFRLEQETLKLDRMGVLQAEASDDDCTQVCMEELHLSPGEPVRRVILPVRVCRAALAELTQFVSSENGL
ncbi:hypothetical protein [Paludibacterium purpuratum]|uniref:Uncharacterized protein n=1 Tax=Paludibacterium purpuratum TaxID=1144873 RepID=A0A4R7B846_9NEIS|nr:hypothetical protein [Paludibacterium purpuratum]TDR79896.1 hypothetical protein DFP86_10635 [Paludibacterium purpuratum]